MHPDTNDKTENNVTMSSNLEAASQDGQPSGPSKKADLFGVGAILVMFAFMTVVVAIAVAVGGAGLYATFHYLDPESWKFTFAVVAVAGITAMLAAPGGVPLGPAFCSDDSREGTLFQRGSMGLVAMLIVPILEPGLFFFAGALGGFVGLIASDCESRTTMTVSILTISTLAGVVMGVAFASFSRNETPASG